MYEQRALCTVRGCDQAQPATLVVGGEMFLCVAGLDAEHVRLDPDLQKMDACRPRRVELAVAHPAARAHPLHIARADHGAVAHGVLVRKFPLEHIADDLHVAMCVGTEPGTGLDSVFVDHAQRTEFHVQRIEVIGE